MMWLSFQSGLWRPTSRIQLQNEYGLGAFAYLGGSGTITSPYQYLLSFSVTVSTSGLALINSSGHTTSGGAVAAIHGAAEINGVPCLTNTNAAPIGTWTVRSEENTSELQSRMRISYSVFC